MITKSRELQGGPADFYGLSTDAKPGAQDNVQNGDLFVEMDTGELYLFDAAGARWLKWGGSG